MKKVKLFIVATLAGALGCSTGEGPKQYNTGDNYFFIGAQDPVEMYLEMYNQQAESATGRDRTTKPSAELTVPVSALP